MNFACHQSSNGMQISIGAHEGSYPAWWKDIRVELYGSSPSKDTVIGDSKTSSVPIERSQHSVSLTVPDSGRGFTIELR
jgi:alpha-glucosidase